MINIKDEKVKIVLEEMNKAMRQKVKRGSKENDAIVAENRVMKILCHDFTGQPIELAAALNKRFVLNMRGDEVITILRGRRMGNPAERRELLIWAEKVCMLFAAAIQGDNEKFQEFEKLRKTSALSSGKKHDIQERLAAIMIFEKHPEINVYGDGDHIEFLGTTLAKYYFYDMADAIANVYGFTSNHGGKGNHYKKSEKLELSSSDAQMEIERLERSLERTNDMLVELQNEFEQQLEESKAKELADFFAQLNSEKYGCILDQLLSVRKGMDELRKKGYELPIEINGLLIMVKKLIQFVKDSHISPIKKVDNIEVVKASDIEFCSYEGDAFESPEEEKIVKVISPGWIYKDKELQISRPKIREEK